ncbi:MAG: hypothetical protein LOD90_07675, partial [Symbiobacteriaceae bacterium]
RELNRLGIVAFSRAVLLDPPPELTQPSSTSDARAFRAGTVVAWLPALERALLAGPPAAPVRAPGHLPRPGMFRVPSVRVASCLPDSTIVVAICRG